MKTCPKCNRTFEDSFSFCLEDGAVLSPSSDPSGDATPTQILKNKPPPQTSSTTSWKYAFIGLALIVFLGIGLFALAIYINMGNTTISQNNSNGSENKNSKIDLPDTTPTTIPKEIKTPQPTNEEISEEMPEENVSTPEEKPKVNKLDQGISKLRQDLSYAIARRILIDAGWQAVVRSPNREKFGSEEYIFDKLNFTEVESCSGTGMGFCRFLFRDLNNRKLVVITAGNEEGIEGGPVVNNWFFEK